jgi:hypothetical protein
MATARAAHVLRTLAASLAVALPTSTARAQFYEKVDLGKASVNAVVEAFDGDDPRIGSLAANLAGAGDPSADALFRAMARGAGPATRVYGVLGQALLSKKGVDAQLFAALASADERADVVREANVSGLLRETSIAPLLACKDLSEASQLTLMAELSRRGEPWDASRMREIAASKDAIAAGFAALLLAAGGNGVDADPKAAAWGACRARIAAMAPTDRDEAIRAIAEAAMLFDVKPAARRLLELTDAEGGSDDARVAAIGAAIRLDTPLGVDAWRARAKANRSQLALMRSAMQLLANAERGVPPTAFDEVRNGTPALEAIAAAGASLASKAPPADALIGLLESGHQASAEWAMVRATELPPEQALPVWKHLLTRLETSDPDDRPTAALISGLARELVEADPAAAAALLERLATEPDLLVAAMQGICDSQAPQAQEIARARRGSLPRAGEGLAALALARRGAPLTDADLDVLGRAGAGGGDLDPSHALQAAWFYARAKGLADGAIERLAVAPPAQGAKGP